MRKSKLSVICGLKVMDAVSDEDGAGIGFENGISLAIYNSYELLGFALNHTQQLIGKTVTHVEDGTDTVTIRFENNLILRIDMRDEAYTGPEALILRVPEKPIVVWN